jgi:hypothetical protein
MKITMKQLMEWVGNQGYSDKQADFMAEILLEVANGKYSASELKTDIESY